LLSISSFGGTIFFYLLFFLDFFHLNPSLSLSLSSYNILITTNPLIKMAFSPCLVGGCLWSKVRAELKGSWKKSLEKMVPYQRAQIFFWSSQHENHTKLYTPSSSPLYPYQDFTSVCPCTNYSHTKPCPPAEMPRSLVLKRTLSFVVFAS
jgi:hypothetical protein